MDVTLKEPANIAASGPCGHSASQNIYVEDFLGVLFEDSAVVVMEFFFSFVLILLMDLILRNAMMRVSLPTLLFQFLLLFSQKCAYVYIYFSIAVKPTREAEACKCC